MRALNSFPASLEIRRVALARLLLAPMVIVLSLTACERRRASLRVHEALNAPMIVVTNGQAAILKNGDRFLAVVPLYLQHSRIQYRVYLATDSGFSDGGAPILSNEITTRTPVDLEGIRVIVGYGGENATEVMLDIDDLATDITLVTTNALSALRLSELRFRTNRPLDPNDLAESMGIGRKPKR